MAISLPIPVIILLAGGLFALFNFYLQNWVRQDNLLEVAKFHGALGVVTFIFSMMKTAPYGRHASESKLPIVVNARWGWITQEAPTLLTTVPLLYSFLAAAPEWNTKVLVSGLSIGLYVLHYIHRTLIFPFQIKTGNDMPYMVTFLALLYCTFNGLLQAAAFKASAASAPAVNTQLAAVGVAIYFAGMAINIHSDYSLIALRKKSSGYSIPHGGMFSILSCPNFFGEFVEWNGYAIVVAAVSGGFATPAALAAQSFAIYTAANTFPRAASHHQFYVKKFGEKYTKLNRYVVIPFIW